MEQIQIIFFVRFKSTKSWKEKFLKLYNLNVKIVNFIDQVKEIKVSCPTDPDYG